MTTHAIRLALALTMTGALATCGMWDSEETLSGERIRIRDQVSRSDTGPTQTAAPLPGPTANQDWTQTNGRASHASGHLAGPSAPAAAWRANAGSGGGSGGRITGAPIVTGGRVYTLDADARLAAFDAGSGAQAWRTALAPGGEFEGFGGGLASDGQFIYATTGFGEVLSVDATSGQIVWRQRTDAPFRAAPAVSDGVVVAVTRDNRALALSARTGQVIWRIDGATADTGLLGGASPALSGDLAVVPFASGEIVGAQLSTGRRIWSAVLGGARRGLARSSIADVTGDPVIAGRAVVAANQSGRTVAVDGQTGARGWTRSIGAVGPIWAAGASIFMVSDDSALVRLSLENGETIWRVDLPAYSDPGDRQGAIAYSGPVLVGGNVLVTDSRGTMLSFDPASGAQGESVALAGGSTTGPVVANGTVYVLTEDGTLQAFR